MQGIVAHSNGRLITCTRARRTIKPLRVNGTEITTLVQAKRRVCLNACTPRKKMPTANKGSASAAMVATIACSIRSAIAARGFPRRVRANALAKANATPAPTPIKAHCRIGSSAGIQTLGAPSCHALSAIPICSNGAQATTGCAAIAVLNNSKPRPSTNPHRATNPSLSAPTAVASAMPKWMMVNAKNNKVATPGSIAINAKHASIWHK